MKLNGAVTTCVLLALLPVVCCAQPTESSAPEALDKGITPIEENVIDRTVVVTQLHIAQARAYIHRNMLQEASSEISEAQRLMRTLRFDLSSTIAGERITIARKHLEFEPAQQVLQDIPSIYLALEQMKSYLPTNDARQHVEHAETYLKKGDKRAAAKELAAAESALPAIEEELPLLSAEKYVADAAKYLAAAEPKKADAALATAEQRMTANAAAGETPIQRAERNLWQATRNYSAGHIPEAKIYLDQAAESLGMAARTGIASAQEEIRKLSEQIARLKVQIDKGDKDRQSIMQSFWERGKALAERSGDYLFARIEKGKSNALEDGLIEAKLHLAYARSYQLTAVEPELAVQEIERAESYLEQVRKQIRADPAAKRKLAAAVKELEYLKVHPNKSEAGARQRYDWIKATLKELLQKL